MLFSYENKRDFQRAVLDLPILIKKGEDTMDGICKDLSSSGMLINCDQSGLELGDEITISLQTENTNFPPFYADAKVLRIDDSNIAVTFLKIF